MSQIHEIKSWLNIIINSCWVVKTNDFYKNKDNSNKIEIKKNNVKKSDSNNFQFMENCYCGKYS